MRYYITETTHKKYVMWIKLSKVVMCTGIRTSVILLLGMLLVSFDRCTAGSTGYTRYRHGMGSDDMNALHSGLQHNDLHQSDLQHSDLQHNDLQHRHLQRDSNLRRIVHLRDRVDRMHLRQMTDKIRIDNLQRAVEGLQLQQQQLQQQQVHQKQEQLSERVSQQQSSADDHNADLHDSDTGLQKDLAHARLGLRTLQSSRNGQHKDPSSDSPKNILDTKMADGKLQTDEMSSASLNEIAQIENGMHRNSKHSAEFSVTDDENNSTRLMLTSPVEKMFTKSNLALHEDPDNKSQVSIIHGNHDKKYSYLSSNENQRKATAWLEAELLRLKELVLDLEMSCNVTADMHQKQEVETRLEGLGEGITVLQGGLTKASSRIEATQALVAALTEEGRTATEEVHKTDARVAELERQVASLQENLNEALASFPDGFLSRPQQQTVATNLGALATLRAGLAKVQQSSVQLLEAVDALEIKRVADRRQLLREVANLEFNMSRTMEEHREELKRYHDSVKTELKLTEDVTAIREKMQDMNIKLHEKNAEQTRTNDIIEKLTARLFQFEKRVTSTIGVTMDDELFTELIMEKKTLPRDGSVMTYSGDPSRLKHLDSQTARRGNKKRHKRRHRKSV